MYTLIFHQRFIAILYFPISGTHVCWSCSCSSQQWVVVNLNPQKLYLHLESSPPGSPSSSCGCASGSTWEQADPEPPPPVIPLHNRAMSGHSPAHKPEKTCVHSHAEDTGHTDKDAFTIVVIFYFI